MNDDTRTLEDDRYGFRWGPMSVVRAAIFPRHRVLSITADGGDSLDVYVSPTGRSVRVYKNGKELR